MPGFACSADHVLAELERVDLMVRGRVARLRQVAAADENFRGLYISEADVDALLARPLGRPEWLLDAPANVDSGLRTAIDKRRAASKIELRLDRLAATFGLDAVAVDVLLVGLAVELDQRYEKLYAYLQDDVTRRRPSVELVLQLVGVGAVAGRTRFAASAPLIAHRLVELVDDPQRPHAPLIAAIVKVDDRIVDYLLDGDAVDSRLAGAVTVVTPMRRLDALRIDDAARSALRNTARLLDADPSPVVVLNAPAGSGKATVAEALAAERGCTLLVVDVAALADAPWPETAARVEREAALRGAAVLWRGLDTLAEATPRSALLRAIDHGRAPCLVSDAVDAASAFPRRGASVVALPAPSHADRAQAWADGLAGLAVEPVDLAGLAARFKLSYGRIAAAVVAAHRLALARGGEAAVVSARDLQDACRQVSNQRLAVLARKVAATASWNDLVLPPDRTAQLREICNHVRYRARVYGDWGFARKLALGKGLAVLFAGPSGTGKTMAAGVLANELSLDMYRIDLSSVISKYIGETEKNLSRIFDEAETSNAILFFDEADALFGKRSEVRDSHDRYANVEVGYLLQRMEEYEGIAILATNLRKNMDDAFVRRLQFTIDFPFPDKADRQRLWQGAWPAETPLAPDVDLDLLSERYEMTGGNIKNVAVAAAFLAADGGNNVAMSHVVQATLREYQKTGKLMGADDFAGAAGRR